MKQKQKINISKIADEIESQSDLMMYWDYRDELTDEQVIKIITEEEGLNDIENELYEYNIDCIYESVTDSINKYLEENKLNLTDEEQEDLRLECESRFNLNMNELINNSNIKLRVTLESNEDMIYFGGMTTQQDIKNNETLKEFKRVFRRKYKKEDLDKEINNVFDYGLITFYFKVSGKDILKLREQIKEGWIELRKGLFFGLFDSYNGSGSVLEMELLSSIKLNLKDWRLKNTKEEIIKNLKENYNEKYWKVSIKADEIEKYGIQETYCMGEWEEY